MQNQSIIISYYIHWIILERIMKCMKPLFLIYTLHIIFLSIITENPTMDNRVIINAINNAHSCKATIYLLFSYTDYKLITIFILFYFVHFYYFRTSSTYIIYVSLLLTMFTFIIVSFQLQLYNLFII